MLSKTGMDLFRSSSLVYEMATSDEFLKPLSRFRRRIALSNAYYTDFLVSHGTGLFLSPKNATAHHPRPVSSFSKTDMISESYETDATYDLLRPPNPPAPLTGSVKKDNDIACLRLDRYVVCGGEAVTYEVLPSNS